MGAQPTITVTPIYGWGWSGPRFEVPAPFTMRLEPAESNHWVGLVLDDGHEFQGRRILLSQRHTEWDGHVNVAVEPTDPEGQPSYGFAILEEPPFAD
jgi:hypothetical protein